METTIAGASWGPNDQIIFGTSAGGLFQVPASGGDPVALTTLDEGRGELAHVWPSIIAGHQAVLFSAGRGQSVSSWELAALALETGEISRLGLAGTLPRYVPTGHLIYVADDQSLRAVPFDPEQLSVTGSPVAVLEDLTLTAFGDANVRVSDSGRLIYISGTQVGSLAKSW